MRASRDSAGPTHSRNKPATLTAADGTASALGGRVAAHRRAAGLTLAQVADRADLSPAYISQIEVGTANPTLATLVRVTDALATDVVALLGGAGTSEFEATVRRRPVVPPPDGTGRVWDYSAPGSSRLATRLVAGEAGDHAHDTSHDGEELITVLAGSYQVVVAGRQLELAVGDAVHFPAGEVHRLSPAGDDALCLIVIGR